MAGRHLLRRAWRRTSSWFSTRWPSNPTKALGRRGEKAAASYLRSLGLKIVASGLRTRTGELDLVAVDGRTVVFVEVKTRAGTTAGHPVEAVDLPKQRRLVREGLFFLKSHGLLEHAARFDVVAVTWPPAARRPVIAHYPRAFDPPDRGQMFT